MKKILVLTLALLLIIPTFSAFAYDYLPTIEFEAYDCAADAVGDGSLRGGYWSTGSNGYGFKWDADNEKYPDVIWDIYCPFEGQYEVLASYKAVNASNHPDRVYIDGEIFVTESAFTQEWMGKDADFYTESLGAVYLTEGAHEIKMTEKTNAGGFYLKSIIIKDAVEGKPVIEDDKSTLIQAEDGTNPSKVTREIHTNPYTVQIVSDKAGKALLGISEIGWKDGTANIYVNDVLQIEKYAPQKSDSTSNYLYHANYVKDYFVIDVQKGLNFVKIEPVGDSYIYVDYFDFSGMIDENSAPEREVYIDATSNTYFAYRDLSPTAQYYAPLKLKLYAPEDGLYNVKLHWSGYDGTDTADISLNGAFYANTKPSRFDTSLYNKPANFLEDTYKLPLVQGVNEVTISAVSGKWCYIDYAKFSKVVSEPAPKTLKFDDYKLTSPLDSGVEYNTLAEAKSVLKKVQVLGSVLNEKETDESVAIFVAAYDANKKLISMDVKDLGTISAGLSSDIAAVVDIENAASIKVFAVKDFSSLMPLCKVVVID